MFWQILLGIILTPIALVSIFLTVCIAIGIVKGIKQYFKKV